MNALLAIIFGADAAVKMVAMGPRRYLDDSERIRDLASALLTLAVNLALALALALACSPYIAHPRGKPCSPSLLTLAVNLAHPTLLTLAVNLALALALALACSPSR